MSYAMTGILFLFIAALIGLCGRRDQAQRATIAEQQQHIGELKAELKAAIDAHGRIFAEGQQAERLTWMDVPLYKAGYEHGEKHGYNRAWIEQAACTCEMQLLRESGELSI